METPYGERARCAAVIAGGFGTGAAADLAQMRRQAAAPKEQSEEKSV